MLKYIIAGFLLFNLGLANAFNAQKIRKVESSTVCELCTFVLSAAQSLLEQNKTETQILNFIENNFCKKLGALNTTCIDYIEKNGQEIINMLAQGIHPAKICATIGVCPGAKHEIQHPRVKSLNKKMSRDSLNCTLCKLVFTQVQDALKNNASEEQLLQFIEKTLCNATGSLSQTCKNLIETYGPTFLKYLASGVDPEKLCELIGMCKKSAYRNRLTKEKSKFAKPSRFGKFGAKIAKTHLVKGDHSYCTACQYAAQFIEVSIQKYSTEQAIFKVLDEVCKLAPPMTQKQCQELIAVYGMYFVQEVIQYGDPLKVCQAIKLC